MSVLYVPVGGLLALLVLTLMLSLRAESAAPAPRVVVKRELCFELVTYPQQIVCHDQTYWHPIGAPSRVKPTPQN